MSEELTISKIRLRLSYDSSGVSAELITPASEPVHDHEATDSLPPQFQLLKWERKARKPILAGTMTQHCTMQWLTSRGEWVLEVPQWSGVFHARPCKVVRRQDSRAWPGQGPHNPYTRWGKGSLWLAYWLTLTLYIAIRLRENNPKCGLIWIIELFCV